VEPEANTYAHGVAVGHDGALLLVGESTAAVDFGAAGVLTHSGFVAKLSASGDPLWFRENGSGTAEFLAVTTDAVGNVYAAGITQFGATLGGVELDGDGGFVVSFDPDGNQRWLNPIVGPSVMPTSLCIDQSGTIGLAVACDGGAYVDPIAVQYPAWVDAQDHSLCLLSLDAETGKANWGTRMDGDEKFDAPPQVASDESGNFFVLGKVYDELDFGAGPFAADGHEAVFVAAFDESGAFRWHQSFAGSAAEIGSITLNTNGDIVALLGVGGDVTIDGAKRGGDEYALASTLVWLSPDGSVKQHHAVAGQSYLSSLAVGPSGIALTGAKDFSTGPEVFVTCNENGASCRSGWLNEHWEDRQVRCTRTERSSPRARSFVTSHRPTGLSQSSGSSTSNRVLMAALVPPSRATIDSECPLRDRAREPGWKRRVGRDGSRLGQG
jgi:hypothetical protein